MVTPDVWIVILDPIEWTEIPDQDWEAHAPDHRWSASGETKKEALDSLLARLGYPTPEMLAKPGGTTYSLWTKSGESD